jgi:hypothetical protein
VASTAARVALLGHEPQAMTLSADDFAGLLNAEQLELLAEFP